MRLVTVLQSLWVDGECREAGGAVQTLCNPATGKPLADLAMGCRADLEAAVAAARRAQPVWRAVAPETRVQALQRTAELLDNNRGAVAAAIVSEGGLTQREARGAVDKGLVALRHAWVGSADGAPGVRGVIGPSSSPLWPVLRDVARALTAGDTVVVKSAPGTHLAHREWVRLCGHLLPGVVNVVPGDASLGKDLLGTSGIDAFAFTGSRSVAMAVRSTGVPAWIDDGGTDAAIVRRGADIDTAVRAIAWSRLRHGGRACVSSRRIYVDAAIEREFTVRLHEYLGVLEVDDPAKSASMLGPLTSAAAAKACEGRVVKTLRGGARLVLGGFRFRPSGLAGYWLQQTILTNVGLDALPMREEMAGPVLTVTPVADMDSVRDLLVGAEGPLAVSVFERDETAARSWLRDLPARAVWLNAPMCAEQMPLAGEPNRLWRCDVATSGLDHFAASQPFPEVS